ncbi:MAG: hypothetical protein H7836_07970, partial [Magnetococcus sp. YQC-3]
ICLALSNREEALANVPIVLFKIFIKHKNFFDNKKLRIELNRLKSQKEELEKKINSKIEEMENIHFKYKLKCRDLEQEINLLNIKNREKDRQNNNQESDFENFAAQENKISDPELEKKCKELYRSISKKTHPDLVQDKNLIELFSLAKDAYEQLNLLELQRISDLIESDNILDIQNKDEEELLRLKLLLENEILKEKSKIENILNSIQYRITHLTESMDEIDNMIGDKIFTDVYLSKIVQLKRQRDELLG